MPTGGSLGSRAAAAPFLFSKPLLHGQPEATLEHAHFLGSPGRLHRLRAGCGALATVGALDRLLHSERTGARANLGNILHSGCQISGYWRLNNRAKRRCPCVRSLPWRRGHESRFQELESSCAGSIGAGDSHHTLGPVHFPDGFPTGFIQYGPGRRFNGPACGRNRSLRRRYGFHDLREAACCRRGLIRQLPSRCDTSRHTGSPARARNHSRRGRYASHDIRQAARAWNDARGRGCACGHRREPRQGCRAGQPAH